MKRVSSELDALSGPEKEPNREFLILQGVRFAFRVHQVCFVPPSVSVNSELHLFYAFTRQIIELIYFPQV